MAPRGDDEVHDFSEHEFGASPLPKEDRLWRHPSELAGEVAIVSNDSIAIRKRWIERETSRGSAWTAGVVGAVLATGLVALGTHLATAFTSSPNDPDATITTVASASQIAASSNAANPSAALSASMSTRIHAIGQSVAVIDIGKQGANAHCLGVVIRDDGVLMAPAADIAGATSLLVTLPNGVQYVGVSEGVDETSGVALIKINGASGLVPISMSEAGPIAGTMALAVTSSGGTTYSLGTIAKTNMATSTLVDAISTDVPAISAPLGSIVLGEKGNVVGMVTGATATGVVATPTWIAAPVSKELLAQDRVVHGWIGMVDGATYTAPGATRSTGVTIGSIATNSAAAKAGMKSGDVITSVNSLAVQSLSMLRGRLYLISPSSTVRIGVLRNHQRITLSVHLDTYEPDANH